MFGGGTMADMMERSELANAQRAADQARMMVMQAQQLQPAIQGFGAVNIPSGYVCPVLGVGSCLTLGFAHTRSFMSDVFFDNIFTDYAFHQKIQRAARDLQRAYGQLQSVVQQSQGHLDMLARTGHDCANNLESTRGALERTRREIMEQAGGVAPPTYTSAPAGGSTTVASAPAPAYRE